MWISFGTSATSYGVGSYATNPVSNVLGHALVGCALASASGGNCGQDAFSAGFGAVASGMGGHMGFDKFSNGLFTTIVGGVAFGDSVAQSDFAMIHGS